MELQARYSRTDSRSRPAVPCAQCGVTLPAPEWSEALDETRIRHLWSCYFCGYQFECTVFYPAQQAKAA